MRTSMSSDMMQYCSNLMLSIPDSVAVSILDRLELILKKQALFCLVYQGFGERHGIILDNVNLLLSVAFYVIWVDIVYHELVGKWPLEV